MITFKQWQMLNESLGGTFTLGLSQVNAVAPPIGTVLGTEPEAGSELDEAKKMKKKMDVEAGAMMKKPPVDDAAPEDEKPEMDDEEDDDDDDDEEVTDVDKGEEEPEDDEEDSETLTPFMKKMKKMKKNMKKMKKEEQDWFNSVYSMTNSDMNQKFWDGFTTVKEDALIAPTNPNDGLAEPGPGQLGFAPGAMGQPE